MGTYRVDLSSVTQLSLSSVPPTYSDIPYAATGPVRLVTAPSDTARRLYVGALAYLTRVNTTFGPRNIVVDGNTVFSGYMSGDDPGSQPEDVIQRQEYIFRSNNKPFKRRVAAGEIVASSYEKGHIQVRKRAGLVFGNNVSSQFQWITMGVCNTDLGFVKSGNRYYYTPNRFIESGTAIASVQRYTMFASAAWVFPQFYTPSQLYQTILGKPKNGELVTETWAENNSKALDLATELAEMPKTLSSILDGFSLLVDLVKSIKKRQIHLSKVHELTLNKLGVDYITRKRQLDSKYRRLIDNAKSVRRIETLNQRHRRAVKKLDNWVKKQRKIANHDYSQKAATLWLRFRYELSPMLYLVEDAANVLAYSYLTFATSRKRRGDSAEMGIPINWGVKEQLITVPFDDRCWIKSSVGEPKTSNGFKFNLFATAWELLTLSFVVDWFLNIGDVISAFTGGWDPKSAACYSRQIRTTQTLEGKSPGSWVIVDINLYKRSIIDPRLESCLVSRFDLNWFRSLDALSLAWGRNRKLITDNINR